MPNNSLLEAIQEAYALAPTNVIIFDTIEINNPDVGDPIYMVKDLQPLTCLLETGVPVTFQPVPFKLSKPKIGDNGYQDLNISVDNIDRSIGDYVRKAKASRTPTKILYRPYLSTDLSKPQMSPPMRLFLLNSSVTAFEVTGTASFINYLNKRFPSADQYYTTRRFPSLGQ